jgi:hypothetical protein
LASAVFLGYAWRKHRRILDAAQRNPGTSNAAFTNPGFQTRKQPSISGK